MGIDGVGKPGGVGTGAPVDSPARPDATAGFEVGAKETATAVAGSGPSEALVRLQRGEIGLDEYLEVRVQAATAHLGVLPPAQLDFIRETLRAELGSDPVLVELVRRTTGTAASELNR